MWVWRKLWRRILEQLIMTVKNNKTIQTESKDSVLVYSKVSEEVGFAEFWRKADEEKITSFEMSCMRHILPQKKVAREDRPCVKRQTFQHRQSEQNAKNCDYCFLSGGAYERQRCSAYHKRCFNSNKRDHFKVVCRTKWHIKERIYTHRNIKLGASILKKAELVSRRSEESHIFNQTYRTSYK